MAPPLPALSAASRGLLPPFRSRGRARGDPAAAPGAAPGAAAAAASPLTPRRKGRGAAAEAEGAGRAAGREEGGKMAAGELLLPAPPGRFRAEPALGAEDWDQALFGCLDPAPLFPSLDPDPLFGCAFDGGGGAPEPPWDPQSPRRRPAPQVKSEPASPASSCSDSSGASETPIWGPPSPPEMGVKPEPLPPPPCAPREFAQPPRGVKAEGPPQSRRTPPIQPKPPGGGPQSPPKTFVLQPLPGTPPGAIAVLSPSQLLLPGGLLCLRPSPRPPPPKAAIAPSPTPGHAPPAAPQLDVRAQRRQQRMIKNRESASASRRRRREYVQGLERRLHLALADNERLRRDNGHLRERLRELQGQSPPPLPAGPRPHALLCLGALLLLGLHLAPLSPPQPGDPPPAPPPPRGRRHLLGVAELGTPPSIWGPPREPPPRARSPFRNSTLTSLSPWDPQSPPGTPQNPPGTPQSPPGTPQNPPGTPECRSFNRTENLRLADELRGWVQRHQIDRGTPGGPPQSPPRGQVSGSPPWKGPGGARLLPAVPPRAERLPGGQLQLYHGPEPRLLAAIERRDDTFYVVSFRRDHLLLPARSHNKTSRPKMSLVLPAAALNESAMMQVDCEVIDTRVIHVRRPRAPPPARATPPRRPRPLPLAGDGP